MRAVERGAPTAPGMKAFRRFARGVRAMRAVVMTPSSAVRGDGVGAPRGWVMHRNQHNVRWRVMSRALSGDGAPISVVDGAQVVVRDCCA
jgi:hypothetical protein